VTLGCRTRAVLLIPVIAAAMLAAGYFHGSGLWRAGAEPELQQRAAFARAQSSAAVMQMAADENDYAGRDLPPGDLDDDDPDAEILQMPSPAERP
jgi:hypothetical protein